ncbi:hypothetical protein DL770_008642 [Monosporascus sp. CRB-9-2]|nr:hypothetical protein DL770_008642 [Monosporascus sp. CRB-9-2]
MLHDIGAPANREHAVMLVVLRLHFPVPIENPEPYLRRAWQIMGQQYPALGSSLSPANTADPQARSKLTVSHFTPEGWVRSTFSAHPDCKDVDSLFSGMGRPSTTRCCWLPGPGQIVVWSSHWRTDGVGLALLSDSFLSALANVIRLGLLVPLEAYPVQQAPDPPLRPALETLAQSQSRYASEAYTPLLRRAADELVNKFAKGLPSIGFPTIVGSEATLPGPASRAAVILDAATTAKVASSCRSLGVSVTCAVHAAIIYAAARFPQHPLAKSYAAFGPVDLRRPLLARGIEYSSQPYGVLLTGLPICIEGLANGSKGPTKDFATVARELHAVYSQDSARFWDLDDDSGKSVSLLELVELYLGQLIKLCAAPIPDNFPPVTAPDLSSLGKVERYLRHEYPFGDDPESKVEVVDFWIGNEIMTRALQFHLWSWKDELVLSATWNQSFYNKGFVATTLNKIMRELYIGLRIDKLDKGAAKGQSDPLTELSNGNLPYRFTPNDTCVWGQV